MKKCDTSVCLQESEDLNLESKEQQKANGNVLVSAKLTSMQSQPLKAISQTSRTTEMQQRLTQMNSQTSICSAEVSHANLFQLLESGRVSKILEELFFMRYLESLKQSDQDFCFSKMSKDSSQQTMEGVLLQSSHRWMNWGILSNGRFLTARISE